MVYIILLNYNGVKDTIDCISSIKKNNYNSYRIVVVDNASTDNSLEILRKEKDVYDFDLVISNKNNGFSAGNNLGIQFALKNKAEYILLLNNDTIVEKDFLINLLETEKKYNNDIVVTSKILYFASKNMIWYGGGSFNKITSRVKHIGINKIDDKINNIEKEVTFISGCCMLIPSKILLKVGLFEEKYFLYCEDTDYCCRLMKNNIKMIYNPKSIIYHKVNGSTKKISNMITYYNVRNKKLIIKLYINGFKKFFANIYFYMEILKRIILNEYDWKICLKALQDYKVNKFGKINN